MITRPSSALDALLRAGDVPGLVERFDAAVTAGDDQAVDFLELSATVSDGDLAPHRATYYFDVARRGPDRARDATDRFRAAAELCEFPLPASFDALLDADCLAAPAILQLVLGVDAAADRIKYYLVFNSEASDIVNQLSLAAGIDLPAGIDPSAVYIAAVDLDRDGPADLKAYVRLRDDRVAATLRRPEEHRALLAGSRYVVFQQRASGDRRQMYFHASSPDVIERELTEPARAHLAALNAAAPRRLAPWILAYPYAGGALDRSRYTVYFHFDG